MMITTTNAPTLLQLQGCLDLIRRLAYADPESAFDRTMVDTTIAELATALDAHATRLTIANFQRYITSHPLHPGREITMLTLMELAHARDGDPPPIPPTPVLAPDANRAGPHLPKGEMRQRVIDLHARDWSRRAIADYLDISTQSVAYHLTHAGLI